jgi:crotonobetainyl-CoA:carnitine CoA-transferase CaiB-like acyl-CoA transferase
VPGPLDGVRVFDATIFMVGPWASMYLGSLGADVLHIERPDIDWSELAAGIPPTINGTSIGYLAWNLNKRGVDLDMKESLDRRFAHDLIETCDVFVCNMRPGVADKLGLGYDRLREINDQLIYCSATGYGSTGPRANDRATDNAIQALTGFWSTQGARNEQGEMYRHYAQLDATTGNVVAQAILLGLMARKRTGRGQHIEVTMLDACATLQLPRLAEHFAGLVHEPRGSSAFPTAPDRAFLCQDHQWIGVTITSDDEWGRLCGAAGQAELADDVRFATNAARVQNRDELEEQLVEIFVGRPRSYWELTLTRAGIAWGRTMDWGQLRYHTQVLENEALVEVETDAWGTVWSGGPPWRFSQTPARTFGAPIPGIHTTTLKAELEERRGSN